MAAWRPTPTYIRFSILVEGVERLSTMLLTFFGLNGRLDRRCVAFFSVSMNDTLYIVRRPIHDVVNEFCVLRVRDVEKSGGDE